MKKGFGYTFPAIRGIQARQEYFASMCPLSLIPKLFLFDEEEINPELRAQRILNRSRIPEIANYLIANRDSYTFSALTVSIDTFVEFEPHQENDDIGVLHIPMEAKFIINDGQHRRAAIEMALKENPDLGYETIAVVFYLDLGMKRSQQMFSDLNQYAIRPSKSLSVLYDHRDPMAQVSREVVLGLSFFRDLIELEKTSLARRSRKLFTLSSIHGANKALLSNLPEELSIEKAVDLAKEFWTEIFNNIVEWQLVREGKITSAEVRQNHLNSHGIVLHALANIGNYLFANDRNRWKDAIKEIKKIDWSRANTKDWEGRAMHLGAAQKSQHNIILTTNIIKKYMHIPLSHEEAKAEELYMNKSENE